MKVTAVGGSKLASLAVNDCVCVCVSFSLSGPVDNQSDSGYALPPPVSDGMDHLQKLVRFRDQGSIE